MTEDPSSFSEFPRWSRSQRRIGLTGGIASGKSSVGSYLSKVKELPILDADVYSREILSTNNTLIKAVLSRYGTSVQIPNVDTLYSIDRKKLGNIIFGNPVERLWIEELIHPYVIQKFLDELKIYEDIPIVVLIIPLLFEIRLTSMCSEIWLVDCDLDQQFQRLITRDGFTYNQAYDQTLSLLLHKHAV